MMAIKQNQPRTTTGDTPAQPQGARERAIAAYDNARDSAANAGRKAGDQLGEAPLALVAGGIAAGAILAALLPVSRRERDLLTPVTDSIKDKAAAAVSAAKDAGQARLDELGLTRDAGGETIRKIVDGATDAFKTSARAGAAKVRGE
jgi:hypothetical protein